MKTLLGFAKNVWSQNGEDGVLAEIIKRLGIEKGWCVEFGAWDGKHFSNTYGLVEKGWNAVYIEGEPDRYEELKKLPVIAKCAFVSTEAGDENSLDNILATTPIPKDFDVLSIDVDGLDWHIWKSFAGKPKVVIIEINGLYEPGQYFVQTKEEGTFGEGKVRLKHGASFSSMKELGLSKGYSLVASTGNLVFVRNDLVHLLGIPDELNSDELFVDTWLRKPTWFSRAKQKVIGV